MLDNFKPTIIPSNNTKYLKLHRRKRFIGIELYELEIYDLCKLIDGLTQGNILIHLSYTIDKNNLIIDIVKTFENFGKCLLALDKKYLKQIFGEDFYIDNLDDFKIFFETSHYYKYYEVMCNDIKKYLNEHFYFKDQNFIRKPNDKYINI